MKKFFSLLAIASVFIFSASFTKAEEKNPNPCVNIYYFLATPAGDGEINVFLGWEQTQGNGKRIRITTDSGVQEDFPASSTSSFTEPVDGENWITVSVYTGNPKNICFEITIEIDNLLTVKNAFGLSKSVFQ